MEYKSILIVEDDPDLNYTLVNILEMHGFENQIVVMKNGAEALDYLFLQSGIQTGRNLPALIILDINMPKIDGLQVLATIRDIETTKKIPVLIITSSILPQDIERATRYGANDYLVKPLDIDNFIKTVKGFVE